MPRPRPHLRLGSLLAAGALAVAGLALPAQAWAAPPAAPAAPSLTSVGGQGLAASWSAPAAGAAPVTGYLVEVLDPADRVATAFRTAAGTTSHTFSGLDDGTYSARVTALSDEGASPASAESGDVAVTLPLLGRWSFAGLGSTAAGTSVPDTSGRNRPATIRGAGAGTTTGVGGDGLTLPGGGNGSGAAYVELPTGLVNGQDTISISAWLRNETASGNYAALFLGAAANPPSRYVLLNPKNPAGRLKSVMTTGTASTTAPWGTETGISPTTAARGVAGPVTGSSWSLYTTVITPTSITGYLDGTKVGTVAHTTAPSSLGTDLVGYVGRSSYPDPLWKGAVRDLRVYATALTDATVAAQYAADTARADAAALTVPATAVEDLTLPTTGAGGSQVTWTSSAPGVVSATGRVTRSTTADATATLTATVANGGPQVTRTFTVTVPREDAQGDVDRVSRAFDLGVSVVTADLTLRTRVDGVDVAWSSSAPATVAADGAVTRPAARQAVTLTARFTRGQASATRTFEVSVLPADAGRIGTYIRSGNTNRTDALHLALARGASTTYTALNNNRPVLYAPTAQVKLGSPTAFRKPDGTFGLIATVDSNSTTAWVWDSADLLTYTRPRLVTLNTQGLATAAVRVAHDNATGLYRLTYASGATTYEATTRDFTEVSAPRATTAPPAPAPATFPAGAIETSSIGVTAEELARVERKHTRQVNTGTRPVPATSVPVGGTVTLPAGVTATYSNGGSDTRLPVTWDADDVAAVDTSRPGTYPVDGTVRATSYPGTIGEQRADPDVTRGDDGRWYMTASYPENGNGDGYNRVNLRSADTIAGLATAPESTIWHENTSALNRYVWAPELTKIGGTWYVLFTASRSGNVFDIRPMMLRHTGGSLLDRANWVEVGPMLPQAGDSAFSSFSLDMTHFEHGGKDYVVWAEKPGPSQLRIAQVDTADPRQLVSPSRVIATPESAWEVNLEANQYVDEGPAVIERDGRLLMTFSGSTVDDRYSVGLLSARAGADLLDPASWVKTAYPLLVTDDLAGEPTRQSGPGHNSFTTDELGNTVVVYHSRDLASTTNGGLEDPSRWARARTVHFDADGDPVLNMTPAEELDPAFSRVSTTVVVTAAPAVAPGAPGTPTVTDVTSSGATATWTRPGADGGAAVTAYRVQVLEGTTVVSTQEVTGTTAALTGLVAGRSYTVAVQARNSAGLGPAATSAAFRLAELPTPALRYPLATDLREDDTPALDARAVGTVTFEDGATLPGGGDSSTGYVRLPDDAVAGLGDDLTVSVWVRSDTPARNGAAVSFGTPAVGGLPTSYWLLNPTGPAGTARSVMTNGVNPGAPYATEVQVAGPSTTARRGAWVHYTTVFTRTSLTSYVDGVRIGSVAKSRTFADFRAAGVLEGYLGRSGYAADPAFKGSFRDLQVFGSALTDAQVRLVDAQDGFVLDGAATRLSLGDTSAVTRDLTLPATAGDGVAVTWATSDAAVVAADGSVTVGAAARTATLTATLTREGATRTKQFQVTVPGRGDVVARSAELVVLPGVLASGDTLPSLDVDGVITRWSSTAPGLVVTGDRVSATTRTTGVLRVSFSGDGVTTTTREHTVTVLPEAEARVVLGYTRTPLETQVYGPHLARSLHLALGASRTGTTALHDNQGVLFARAVASGTVETGSLRTLVDPHLFRTRTGWGVVATRALGDGTPDASAARSMQLWTSPDLLTWTEVGPVTLDAGGSGVRTPRATWDADRGRYVVSWTSAGGTPWVTTATDVADASTYAVPRTGTVLTSTASATTTAPGAVPGTAVVVDTAVARALQVRWGRPTNTGSSVAGVTTARGTAPDLAAARAQLTYSDGSTATRAVTWDPADVAAVDTTRPGTYTVRGQVRQTPYAFPFIAGRADPSVITWQGKTLFMATDAGESRFDLRSADTIAGLAGAADHTILTTGALPGPLWAPEMHVIGGELWVFFSAGVDQRCWCAVQSHVMKLRTGGDPTRAADWETPRLVQERQGGRLQLDAAHPGISLDMTYFEDTRGGARVSYVAWSQRFTAPSLGDAQLWIATVDPADPARLTSDPVLLAAPDLSWERNTSPVAEAPYVIARDGRLLMTYSGSNIDNTYAVGLLSATAGADLLDPASWTKASAPLLRTDTATTPGQWGPGHSMFAQDEDGNDVVVLHARNGRDGSRDAVVRRVHWAADGTPVLDMSADEEVAPAYRAVTTTVTVLPDAVTPPVVTPPVVTPPVVVPPVVVPPVPPVLVPPPPAPPVVTGKVRGGPARVGRPVRLVLRTTAPRGRVVVEVAGKRYEARARKGRAVLTVRFPRAGAQKVVLRTAGQREVLTVRVRR